MAELLSPGVIIQEVPFGPPPIEGVSTSTAGFVGETLFGQSEGAPVLVTSWPDFQRKFGGFVAGTDLAYAVRGFFENGGRRAYIARVTAQSRGALTLSHDATDGNLVPLLGSITEPTAGNFRMKLGSVVGLEYGTALTIIDRTGAAADVDIDVQDINALTGVITGAVPTAPPSTDPPVAGRGSDRFYARIGTPGAAGTVLELEPRDAGGFSGRLSMTMAAAYGVQTRVRSSVAGTIVELNDASFLAPGDRLQLDGGLGVGRDVVAVQAVDAGTGTVTLTAGLGFDPTGGTASLVTWQIVVSLDGEIVETLDGVTSDPARFRDELAERSDWIRVQPASTTPAPPVDLDPASAVGYPTFARVLPMTFSAGTGGAVGDTDVVGATTPERTGIAALEAQDGINLIAAPGFTAQVVHNALIAQAERLQDRFAVLDVNDEADVNDVLSARGLYNSNYAAIYHPHLDVSDPLTGGSRALAPSGHILGAYARTDNDRGVFKAPANVTLRGVLGFTRDVTTGEQDILNPAGVNVLRRFDDLGFVIWGARTVTADALWKYVPVRRLFIFIEQSIVRGTRFAVFEPNARPLWARLDDAVSAFLETQWRAGALFGETPEQAFFVNVDERTTTQADRDNGVVNIEVGIAPAKPAEFVVFRIGQAPSSVIIAEQS
ncbi:MAG: phage tail sheath subtilisin-like domain-containing protein [Myxococcota bacterium]